TDTGEDDFLAAGGGVR
nr:fibrinopeptide A [Sapajus apella]prf//732189B fibrinopeptide A [Ateles sp.]